MILNPIDEIKAIAWADYELKHLSNEHNESTLRNMTTRELIKYCEDYSDDPIISELSERLERCMDFITNQVGL